MKRFMNPATIFLFIVLALTFSRGILSDPGEWFITELMTLPGIIIGLSFHEYAHGIVAYKMGDPTPKMQGRLTVNPAAHIDPIGFIALLFMGFGWGKAVEINPYNFKNRRRDEFLVSIAGVTMNLILAIVFTVVYKVYVSATGNYFFTPGLGGYLAQIIFYIVYINVVLMIFNLIPVPPLDGFGIVTEIFDLRQKHWYWQVYNNGFFILMLLIIFDVTDLVISPLIRGVMTLLGLF